MSLPDPLPRLLEIARLGGDAILAHYGQDPGTVLKGDDSPLTLADLAAHRVICDELAKHFPDIPIVSEEGMENGTADPAGRFWLVDPLDGTKEFLKQTGSFTVNIGLIENRQPVCGVIHVPATGISYAGAKGQGAYRIEPTLLPHGDSDPLTPARDESQGSSGPLAPSGERVRERGFQEQQSATNTPLAPTGGEGQGGGAREQPRSGSTSPASYTIHPIQVSPPHDPPRFVASRDHAGPEVKRMLAAFPGAECLSIGSSLKFCLIAEGKADVYLRDVPTMEWDTAAAHAVLKAAGGHLLTWAERDSLGYGKPEWRNGSLLSVGEEHGGAAR